VINSDKAGWRREPSPLRNFGPAQGTAPGRFTCNSGHGFAVPDRFHHQKVIYLAPMNANLSDCVSPTPVQGSAYPRRGVSFLKMMVASSVFCGVGILLSHPLKLSFLRLGSGLPSSPSVPSRVNSAKGRRLRSATPLCHSEKRSDEESKAEREGGSHFRPFAESILSLAEGLGVTLEEAQGNCRGLG
jgi:hypothetical protein